MYCVLHCCWYWVWHSFSYTVLHFCLFTGLHWLRYRVEHLGTRMVSHSWVSLSTYWVSHTVCCSVLHCTCELLLWAGGWSEGRDPPPPY